MKNEQKIKDFLRKKELFEKDAHKILGTHEESRSRIITLNVSYDKLSSLNLKQDDLFRQALTCVERECYRAAHIMSWAALMDFLEEKVFEDGGRKIKKERPNWKVNSPEDLREEINEYQIVEALRSLGLCAKSEMKALHGLLNKRNECAHPTDYYPGLNDTLGYITEIINRTETLKHKRL
ncbi:MAG: hypothetical protein A2119_01810 [Candidatus Colwellbacteria bacterium GWA2_46_10]|uniref:DUF4145 domain-containing protein n=1 Tax=Candidatus Colwellbacteria bacterium GWA2_46_10 TaxID=1797684 RepID=A0A1G1YY88_9BACT|nr:MAG: hypothetical protein UW86_C0004G0029 [Microgenomates group bacterium GW2011_GWA1_Microgenomates_45_10]KKU18793.1 MAG: hypothetical protein UX29_C0017G0009 [Parcubacteria group bacterium GW2011_GWA2_46_10]OGY56756.1 MAG: hypothetical protein A2119_01810 [Candidatus Colwellbacteria bacterium GWA2_46_10]